jgi:hypothetical protein
MPNITVTVSESAYRQARIWAALNATSVSAVVQYCIERLPRLRIAQAAAAATARRSGEAARARETPSPGCEKCGCETVKRPSTESNQSDTEQTFTVPQKL